MRLVWNYFIKAFRGRVLPNYSLYVYLNYSKLKALRDYKNKDNKL